jgi:RNA:NAD 2'-phosphotransferase (TPT1/KptA family)
MADLTRISKTISYILRHSNIKTDDNGYIDITILLNHQDLKKYKITFEIIKYIRANQGHSNYKTVKIGEEINNDILFAYHGTSKINCELIMNGIGLSRMNRQHIHMVENKKDVLYYSEVIIKIDIQKAKSDNNYILSSDIIPPECLSIE